MTCVIGLERDNKVWIGSDSAMTGQWHSTGIVGEPKVFSNGELLMGFCGAFRFGQLLQYSLVVPDRDPRKSDMEWLVNDYIDAVREMLTEKGFLHKGDEKEDSIPGSDYLLGYKGKLYYVEENFQVIQIKNDYQATGAGSDLALGALYTLKHSGPWTEFDPATIITRGLDAACHHNASCAPPYAIYKLEDDTVERVQP